MSPLLLVGPSLLQFWCSISSGTQAGQGLFQKETSKIIRVVQAVIKGMAEGTRYLENAISEDGVTLASHFGSLSFEKGIRLVLCSNQGEGGENLEETVLHFM